MNEKLKKILKKIGKGFLFVCFIVFSSSLFFSIKNELNPEIKHELKDYYKYSSSDCHEFGLCKQGVIFTVKNDTFEVTKENCLKYGKAWNEKHSVCFFQ